MYSEKVMDHFQHPRNVGEIENASGVGTVGNAKCGDIMRIYLDIDDNGIIQDVSNGSYQQGSYGSIRWTSTSESSLFFTCRRSNSRSIMGLC